jgi:hypothetical protein
MRICSKSGSGKTATVTVLVCTRPRFSVGGTRCQRIPPDSFRKNSSALGLVDRRVTDPGRWSKISRSKTVASGALCVHAQLFQHEKFGVLSTFCCAYFDDHARKLHWKLSTSLCQMMKRIVLAELMNELYQ